MLHLVWVRNSRWLFLTAFFRLWSLDGHWVFPSPRIFDGWWTEYSCSDDSIKAQPQCMMYQPSVQRPEALFCGSGDLEGCHGPGLVWEAKRVLFHFLLGAGDHWWRRPRVEAPNISPFRKSLGRPWLALPMSFPGSEYGQEDSAGQGSSWSESLYSAPIFFLLWYLAVLFPLLVTRLSLSPSSVEVLNFYHSIFY